MSLLHDYEPPLQEDMESEPKPEDEPRYLDVIAKNEHYRIMGLLGDAVAIRISAGRVLQRTRESLTQPYDPNSNRAPLRWWSGLSGEETLSTAWSRKFGDWPNARRRRREGQVDMAQVYGRGAVRLPGGKIVYHLGDRLLEDGAERPLDDDSITWMAEPSIPLASSCQRICNAG